MYHPELLFQLIFALSVLLLAMQNQIFLDFHFEEKNQGTQSNLAQIFSYVVPYQLLFPTYFCKLLILYYPLNFLK